MYGDDSSSCFSSIILDDFTIFEFELACLRLTARTSSVSCVSDGRVITRILDDEDDVEIVDEAVSVLTEIVLFNFGASLPAKDCLDLRRDFESLVKEVFACVLVPAFIEGSVSLI